MTISREDTCPVWTNTNYIIQYQTWWSRSILIGAAGPLLPLMMLPGQQQHGHQTGATESPCVQLATRPGNVLMVCCGPHAELGGSGHCGVAPGPGPAPPPSHQAQCWAVPLCIAELASSLCSPSWSGGSSDSSGSCNSCCRSRLLT